MFRWGRREFARACIRINLNSKLPCGIWIEGLNGRFYQKVEYENLSSICFKCGRIGHKDFVCPNSNNINLADKEVPSNSSLHDEISLGPWMHVKFKKKKSQKILSNKSVLKDYPANRISGRNPVIEQISDSDTIISVQPVQPVQNSEIPFLVADSVGSASNLPILVADLMGAHESENGVNSNSKSEFKIADNVDEAKGTGYNKPDPLGSDSTEPNIIADMLGDFKSNFEFKNSDDQEEVKEATNSENELVVGPNLNDLMAKSPSTKSVEFSEMVDNIDSVRDTSPTSEISLNFKKTVFKKGKSCSNKTSGSSDSKHILFKELQTLGPVKDLPRRLGELKMKNNIKGSSLLSH
ncbi:hypothetical protein MA16_Dca028500 [Dendrobium catenatum]|uniref:CCHC-type domain-containing protein n=1 Tax=Dendrobium catenatum TaxID=906689 RepID=A0A2I0VAT9_9ASPA|nr:hypothetical protein MA16_Dca028500 [Dendrobium catenatum]